MTSERTARHPDLLTREESAAWCGVSPRFLDGLAAEGRIPVVRQGRRVFFWRRHLDAYLEACTLEASCSTESGGSGTSSTRMAAARSAAASERAIERRLLSRLPASALSTPRLAVVDPESE
jgi:excisionase family DNA binding protein